MISLKKISHTQRMIILWIVNSMTILAAFSIGNAAEFPDEKGYWLMSEGLRHGRFSSWYFLKDYYPETLRTPGYPFFIYIIRSIYDSELFVKLIQLVLHFASLYLALMILKKLTDSKVALYIFLLFTAVNIQLPYYSGYIAAESLNVFLILVYCYILIVKEKNWRNALLLGLTAGAIFQVRPAFVLFPFAITFLVLLSNRRELSYYGIHLLLFLITLIPFAIWNKNNHGVARPTPVEGGAGISHIGFWIFKLPYGYQETYYWGNAVVYDFTNPFSVPDSLKAKNITDFEAEWIEVNNVASRHLSKTDSAYLHYMKNNNPGIYVLYNSNYTIEREKLLWSKTLENILEDPWFYFKTRVYTTCRLYFTGINHDKYDKAESVTEKIKVLFPFLLTFFSIFVGLVIACIFFLYKKFRIGKYPMYLLLLSLYYGVLHCPFAIQARYTVPVHFIILVLFAFVLSEIFDAGKKKPIA